MRNKSVISKVLLVFAMVLAITACSTQKSNTSSSETSNSGTSSTSSTKSENNPKVTLDMMVFQHPSWPYKEDWAIYKYYEEKLGIKFKVTAPPSDYDTALNLAFAGDTPDIMIVSNLAQANTYGSSGALLNFFDHLDKLPNYSKFLEDHPKVKSAILSADGKNYYLPHYGLEQTSRRSWTYRDDIFKKNNLKAPTTWDEMYKAAKELKKLYPDSYPIAIYDNLTGLTNIAAGFGTWYGPYVDYEKDEWRYGPTEDSFKEMLRYLNLFYKEGLIPPDFMAMKRDQFNDLLAQDKAFIANDYIGVIDEVPVIIQRTDDFSLDYMTPPIGGNNGKPYNAYDGLLNRGMAVAADTKNLDTVLKYVDFLYSPEGIELATYGREGETYYQKDGARRFNDEYVNFATLRKSTGIATYGSHLVVDMKAYSYMSSDKFNKAMEKIQNGNEAPLQPRLAYTDAENETLTMKNAEINKYRDEQIAKFILGQRDLSTWDQYVSEIQKLGLDEVMKINEDAYRRAQSFLK
ncbi:extracellular solute-binding protein [Paenibacillus sp. KQZ6P-2]|uniref:Extracellular solute-binding protein n=1 Tax=Paenibacillus mangrovi TaxID=2931978 RepID=A0A9X1WQT6_9BACL|nr:extracellular solute-binding protein [Paenibacillus mangrovi]MCJ8012981.1 extracellular solute-binding protein [Paenibacillus mangrovi]